MTTWHVDGHNLAAVIRKTDKGWETVARCPNDNGNWRDDARLISAAPEMLDALKEALEYFDDKADAEYLPGKAAPVGNREMKLAGEIRAAIAKATGGKS